MQKVFSLKKVFLVIIGVVFMFVIIAVNRQAARKQLLKPKIGPIVETVYALGTVKSDIVFNLRLGMAATITKIYVSEGQYIKRGAPLIDTDSSNTLYSPINGVVSKIYFENYENAVPGTNVLTVMDLSRHHILLSLDQQSALRVKAKQIVELNFEGIRQQKFKGFIDRVYSSAGQFLAKIRAEKLPEGILPDMTVDVAIEVGRKEKAIMVPASAVKNGMVTIIRQKKLIKVPVTLGLISDEWVEIVGGAIMPSDGILNK